MNDDFLKSHVLHAAKCYVSFPLSVVEDDSRGCSLHNSSCLNVLGLRLLSPTFAFAWFCCDKKQCKLPKMVFHQILFLESEWPRPFSLVHWSPVRVTCSQVYPHMPWHLLLFCPFSLNWNDTRLGQNWQGTLNWGVTVTPGRICLFGILSVVAFQWLRFGFRLQRRQLPKVKNLRHAVRVQGARS